MKMYTRPDRCSKAIIIYKKETPQTCQMIIHKNMRLPDKILITFYQ